MPNTPAIQMMMGAQAPAMSADLAQKIGMNFIGADTDFGSQFRSISLKGSRFTLREGQTSNTLSQTELLVVILGIGPDYHCVYYKDKYKAGSENVQPTAVWYQKEEKPAIVPDSAMKKDAQGFLGYKLCRRLVVALMNGGPNGEIFADLANPYVLDVGSKSIFGNDYPNSMAYSLAGLFRLCQKLGPQIRPLHFITKLVFDTHESVPTLRFIPHNVNGYVQYFDTSTLDAIYAIALDSSITEMLKIKRIPDPTQAIEDAEAARLQAQQAAAQTQAEVMAKQAQVNAAAFAQPQPAPQVSPIPTPQPQPVPQVSPIPTPQPQPDLMAQAKAAAQAAQATIAQPQPAVQPQGSESDLQSALGDLLSAANSYGGK